MTMLLDLAVRSSLVLVAGLLAARLLARRSAALRHAVLAASLFGAAAVVPLTLVVPAWTVPASSVLTSRLIVDRTESPLVSDQSSAVERTPAKLVMSAEEPPPPTDAGGPLAVFVWLLGISVTAGSAALGLLRIVRITRQSARMTDERWTRAASRLVRACGIQREIDLLQTRSSDMLATWGLFRPCVLLPSHAREWSDERIHLVLCHEFAHIRRRDWLVQIAAELVRIVYWFNPLVWMTCARLRRDSEQACDDAVLDAGVPPRAYATHLLQLARMCRPRIAGGALPIVASRPSTLERRIAAMLNAHLDRRVLSPRAIIATTLLLAGITVPAAAFRFQQTSPLPLKGTVYDPSGAVLPEVTLTLATAQGAKIAATTDASGRFEFASVEPGTYMLEAALPGFRALRHPLELRNAGDWDRAVTLQVGDVQETINVSAPRPSAPAAASAIPERIRVGGNIRAPRKLRDVRPVYPPAMRDSGREGVVPLEAVIGTDGAVTSLRVVTAQVHPDFAIAAMDAVRQWRFTPTLLNGEPVEVVMNVSVSFTLSD